MAPCRRQFTDLPDVALFSDSGGSVFELRLRRSLARRSAAARCLFSGSRGEVVTMEPLPTDRHPQHPLQQQMIVAMATMSKVGTPVLVVGCLFMMGVMAVAVIRTSEFIPK